jgi:hypothetical protein
MKFFVQPAKLFLATVVVIPAWLAISNHCALGVTAAIEAKPAPDECPFHAKQSAPSNQKPSSDSPCCKILRAIAVSSAKNLARSIVDLAYVDLSFTKFIVVSPPKIFFGCATLDTGPPGKTSFAQLIRSMRAHAPPKFV